MGRYFGTDGFRGEVNVALNAEHGYRIGRFLGWYYHRNSEKRVRIVIGRDTRRSGYMLEQSLAAGITASGADVYILGVTTTPSVAWLIRAEGFDCGIMISASHNPYYDNGVKLINGNGEKMEETLIALVEDYIDGWVSVPGEKTEDIPLALRGEIGRTVDFGEGRDRYVDYLVSLAEASFDGARIGLDCANGSAYEMAQRVFESLGAETHVINDRPDGLNINADAGSTHIEGLCDFVCEHHLDAGFAFDGDADRCLAVDEHGNVIDGDMILYICGRYLKERGELEGNTVVTTIMSNFGLYKAFDKAGISYEKTAVGDKYVYENMRKNGFVLGGEQSGHIIFSRYATTGDGILTAVMLMGVMLESGRTLSELAETVDIYPQVLKNVRVKDKAAAQADPDVCGEVARVAENLGDTGRILVRESGTEPLIRVMVEAADRGLCEAYADRVIRVLEKKGHRA